MFTARKKGRLVFGAVVAGAAMALAGCGSADPTGPSTETGTSDDNGDSGDTIIVGSFAFAESQILGEIYSQVLQDAGFTVEESFNIGPRQQTIPALQDGSINLMPEYNGNLLAYYNEEYTERSTEDVNAALTELLPDENLQILESAPGEDKDAYVVTSATAEAGDLTEIGDLANIVPFSLGANSQFGELGYGIPGLRDIYGVGVNAGDVTFVPIEDFGGPDTVAALVQDEVQVADIYTTSPAILAEDLVVLEDPMTMLSAQNITPLVSTSVYSDELADVLNTVSAEITTEDLILLRTRVEGDEQVSAEQAATDWLTEKGLLG